MGGEELTKSALVLNFLLEQQSEILFLPEIHDEA